ncbi:MAG: sortase domain-bontaining protein [Ruminococcus sp.]
MNPEIIAWIRIPDTRIDYPVVQGTDNEYYLKHTFKKTEHVAGSIFLDKDNSPDFSNRKSILYGHNMKDGSMFRGCINMKVNRIYRSIIRYICICQMGKP